MSDARLTTTGFSFQCEGCGDRHHVDATRGWTWRGGLADATVTPSLSVTSGHYRPSFAPGDSCWCGKNYGVACYRCHFTITSGVIQYHGDSTHALAGQTRPL